MPFNDIDIASKEDTQSMLAEWKNKKKMLSLAATTTKK